MLKNIPAKAAFSLIKPELAVFVIVWDTKLNRPTGMAAGYNMKCSTDPYLFAVGLSKNGYTHKLLQLTKEFVVAVPNQSLIKTLETFGSTHGDTVDKFALTGVKIMTAKLIKPPLLRDATINLECKLRQEVDSGDHIIFIGEILAAHHNPDKGVSLNMGKLNGKRIFKEFKTCK